MHNPEPGLLSSQQDDDLLWRHLKSLPAFRALLRAVEARFYHHLEIPDPVLDLGCGDGHFAGMAFNRPLRAGVDPWWGPLRKARRAGVYQLNVQAMGDALPFADGAFASVISNSVLEHIPDIQPVLNEASRVLRPGGKLVITMPSHLFTENLAGAALLKPFGLGDAYRRFFNRISRHAHTDPPEIWAQRLAQAGFAVERWHPYFSKEALRALEIGHLQGLPSAILHALTGHWIVAPWRESLRPTERWLRPYYDEQPAPQGAYLIMVARKSAQPLPAASEVEVRLPAPRPLPIAEPQPEAEAAGLPYSVEPQTPVEEVAEAEEDEQVFTVPASISLDSDAAAAPAPARSNRPLFAGILLLIGLLAAFTAQGILSQRLPSAWSGLRWYGAALLAMAAGAALLRRPAGAPLLSRFSRRTLLLPLAFVLALLAQEQSGGAVSGGHPLVALLLWAGGAALAFFALSAPQETPDPDEAAAPQASRVAHYDDPLDAQQNSFLLPLTLLALFLAALIPRLMLLTAHPFIINGIEASIGLDAGAVLAGQIRNPFATAWLTNPTLPLFPATIPLLLFGRSVLAVRLLPVIVGAVTVPILFLIARRLWGFWFALASALFLAGYHLHLHYSRIGMTNIWDPLLALLVFGALSVAVTTTDRKSWLWAGVAVGACAYFYTASHLVPFFLIGFALFLLFLRRDILRQNGANLLAASALALVVALPQIIYYQNNPGLFMERANVLGILQSDWLLQQAAGGNSVAAVFGDQLRRAFFAFNGSLDMSTSYNPGIPLLRGWAAVFFTIGVALALWRVRRARFALALLWLFVTLLFGGALLVDAPGSHRVLIATPFVAILLTAGLFWLARRFYEASAPYWQGSDAPAPSRAALFPALAPLLLILLFIAGDLFFYFGQYRQEARFADRNSEVAHEMGRYLDSLEGEWYAYFHGPPAMYVGFPTLQYLAEQFQPGLNLVDVPENMTMPPEAPPDANVVFIYLPERSAEVNQTAQRYPDGQFLTFDGRLQNPLFYSYEVRP